LALVLIAISAGSQACAANGVSTASGANPVVIIDSQQLPASVALSSYRTVSVSEVSANDGYVVVSGLLSCSDAHSQEVDRVGCGSFVHYYFPMGPVNGQPLAGFMVSDELRRGSREAFTAVAQMKESIDAFCISRANVESNEGSSGARPPFSIPRVNLSDEMCGAAGSDFMDKIRYVFLSDDRSSDWLRFSATSVVFELHFSNDDDGYLLKQVLAHSPLGFP
jgi:hypothetical protein